MVRKKGIKLRNGEDNFSSHNMANLFLFSTVHVFMFRKITFKIVPFLEVGSKVCL